VRGNLNPYKFPLVTLSRVQHICLSVQHMLQYPQQQPAAGLAIVVVIHQLSYPIALADHRPSGSSHMPTNVALSQYATEARHAEADLSLYNNNLQAH
jgi:hypothetical protein